MIKGVQLTLMIGQGALAPAPRPVIEALTSVQVNSQRGSTGFQLAFAVGKTSPLQTSMLPSGFFDPIDTRVVIVVTMNGTLSVLCDGVITRHDVSPSNDPGQSTFTVTGEDLSVLMNLEQVKKTYPGTSDTERIQQILSRYQKYGISPNIIEPKVRVSNTQNERIPTQTETDLEYIRKLAGEAGYTFYIEPGPAPQQSIAYFGPDNGAMSSQPQRALSVNSDWGTNVDSLSFNLDGLSKQTTVMMVLDPKNGKKPQPVPVPNISDIKPPLGARQLKPARVIYLNNSAALTPDEAAKRAYGIRRQSSQSISGNGSLNVIRYGGILKARQLVGVRGAGRAYDGLYYVDSVTHNIKVGEYKQNFSLSRDGLVSQTETVTP